MARARKSRFSSSTLVLALGLVTVACSPQSKEAPGEAKAGVPEADGAAAEGAGDDDSTSGEGEAETGETGGGTEGDVAPAPVDLDVKTGVASCDDYAQWWSTCVHEHAPADQRGDLERELSEQLAAWKQTVDGGGSAKAVEIGCATALEAAKAMSANWECAAPGEAP